MRFKLYVNNDIRLNFLGTLDPFSMGCYQMTTVDAVFVREKYRGQGFGSSAVKDVLIDFPLEDIGFSFPVSIPMQKSKAKRNITGCILLGSSSWRACHQNFNER